MKTDNEAVKNVLKCMEEVECDPFDPKTPVLRSLQSGTLAPTKLIKDVNSVIEEEVHQSEELMEIRVHKTESLYDKISRNSILNFFSKI